MELLRSMTPAQRAEKAFELSDFTKRLFLDGLRNRYPELSEAEFHKLALEHLARCHNRNY